MEKVSSEPAQSSFSSTVCSCGLCAKRYNMLMVVFWPLDFTFCFNIGTCPPAFSLHKAGGAWQIPAPRCHLADSQPLNAQCGTHIQDVESSCVTNSLLLLLLLTFCSLFSFYLPPCTTCLSDASAFLIHPCCDAPSPPSHPSSLSPLCAASPSPLVSHAHCPPSLLFPSLPFFAYRGCQGL